MSGTGTGINLERGRAQELRQAEAGVTRGACQVRQDQGEVLEVPEAPAAGMGKQVAVQKAALVATG